MEGLKNYRVFNRRYRNRRIGEFLKELHLTEGRNTGFGKILRALEKNGSPKPIFETDDARTSFAATIFIHPGFSAGGNDSGNNNGNDSGNENQSDNAERILKIMKNTPHITIDHIVSITGISKRTVSRIIKELREKDIIRREGTKNGTWKGRFLLISQPLVIGTVQVSLRILDDRQSVFQTDDVAEPSDSSAGTEEIFEFPLTVQCSGVKNHMVMQVFFVHMGTDNKGVFTFQKTHGKCVSDLVRFLWRDLSRLEGLANLIGDHIAFLFSAGEDAVLPFR